MTLNDPEPMIASQVNKDIAIYRYPYETKTKLLKAIT